MKKLLMVILCASVISPSFAFAKSESSHGENGARHAVKAAQVVHFKKIENKHSSLENENKPKKVNYFFCVTATGWNIVPMAGEKEMNSNVALGEDCVKLPGNIAKKLQAINTPTATTTPVVVPVATTTPDIIAPVISSVTTSGIASTTATVSWNTNKLATGKVYYGISTSTSTMPFVYSATSSLSHTFTLTGLATSSTYNFFVESVDVANNTATSTLSSFLTTL